MALVALVIKASSPGAGTPVDQFPPVNQLPEMLDVQLFVTAQAELPGLASTITSVIPAKRTRAEVRPQVGVDKLTLRSLMAVLQIITGFFSVPCSPPSL